MATPTSSTTSASPPMTYLQPTSDAVVVNENMDTDELEQRRKAVQKFMARAEISMVTRGLRARLAYASYKAAHGIPHVSLRELEAQSQYQSQPRTAGTKRKAGGGHGNYYHYPSTQTIGMGVNSGSPTPGGGSGASRRGGAMPPPQVSASASRSHYPTSNSSTAAVQRSWSNSGPSLYTSILAPPPAKHARTIHNVADPPLPPPTRPVSVATGASPKSRKTPRSAKKASGVDKRKDKRSSPGKGKQKEGLEPPGEDADIKAAATLTSLLMHARPSIPSTGTSSPPSSKSNISDAGSASHHTQNSTRSIAATVTLSAESSFVSQRTSTPPPIGERSAHTTPKATGNARGKFGDSEAADLMLFLATSPSPARPNSNGERDARDGAAFKALSGNNALRTKGRVLFPLGSVDGGSGGVEGASGGGGLSRGVEGSFASSMSSISSQVGGPAGSGDYGAHLSDHASVPSDDNTSTPSTFLSALPLPSSPSSNQTLQLQPSWPSSYYPSDGFPKETPPSPPGVPFNFNDFINVSPSPATVEHVRKDRGERVGRRLFEELDGDGEDGERGGEDGIGQGNGLGLGAGIDLGLGAGIDLGS